jgi:glycosyltransferase involved in cell wall biosynthesis
LVLQKKPNQKQKQKKVAGVEMKKKIRVLAWSDFVCHTGFGIVAHYLYSGLYNLGDYDIRVVGINYLGQKDPGYPFFVYPTDSRDRMGYTRIIDAVNDIKPINIDVLFLFQDIWNIKHVTMRQTQEKERFIETLKKINPNIKVISYFPLDGAPFNDYWIDALELCDLNITYTEFGKNEVNQVVQQHGKSDKVKIEAIPHAIDSNIFHLLPADKRNFYANKRGWNRKFVVFTINRFQPRKNFASMLRAFALFINGYKKCECGNYYPITDSYCDLNLCGEEKVVSVQKGCEDVHYYLHCEWSNYAMGGNNPNMPENDLPSAMRTAGFTYDQIRESVEILENGAYDLGKISLSELNRIYNAADCFVTTTLGEGWGLSNTEALATGTHIIAPRNTALPENTGNHGELVDNCGFMFLPSDNSYKRPLVHVPAVVNAIDAEYKRWLKNGKKKVIRENAIKHATRFSWDDIVKRFDGLIREAVNEKVES